ncbi:YdcF family protein [Microvirga flavescens]|uniref:YdcF family protein n=1 Tax=Microvirga flavescens TaxID=2249811 RepID=UPI000DD79D10|nr:YdcF family protein [Microvirga flavescens]
MIFRAQRTANTSALEATEAFGWGWSAHAEHTPTRKSWLLRCFFAGFCLSLAAIVCGFFGFIGFVYSLDRFEAPPQTRANGIVALTGGSQRIDDAIDLLAKGYADRLLISGVNEKTSREQISRLNPGQRHLFDCCVDLDYRARNTIGNAIEIRRWTERNRFSSLIVVTSNYHMPRALVELDHAFPKIQKIPYSVAASIDPHDWWRSLGAVRVLFSEYVKFVAVWVRTRFEQDPETSAAAKIMSGGAPMMIADPAER